MRGALSGGDPEQVFQGWLAAEALAIDSLHGYLYWVTPQTVEATRLNGDHHRVLHTLEYYSGKYVLGLSVASDTQRLYWMVKEGNNTLIYYTSLLVGPAPMLEPVHLLQQLPLPPRWVLLTHWSLGDLDAILKMQMLILFYWWVFLELLMIMPSDECHAMLLM